MRKRASLKVLLLLLFLAAGQAGQVRAQEPQVRLMRGGRVMTLGLEDYLIGVLAGEVSPNWPLEALKTMAVCARTYTINKMMVNSGGNYHLTDTMMDQVYKGNGRLWSSIRQAVDETRNEVLTYESAPAQVFYCASSGGCTASSLVVWGRYYPYLQAVADIYSTSDPYANWTLKVSERDFLRALGYTGHLGSIEVAERDESGRVGRLRIEVSGRSFQVAGRDIQRLRERLGWERLCSTLFDVKLEAGQVVFTGRGWGHGVGLSQWGSKRMAESGFTYQQILQFYFPGTTLGIIQSEE